MTLWDWNFALETLPMLGKGLLVTLQVTFTATAIFLLLGLVIALIQRSCPRWINAPLSFVTEFIRRTPLLVQLYFVYFVYVRKTFGMCEGICADMCGTHVC